MARKIIGTLQWRDRQAVKTAGANVTVRALGYAIRLVVIPLSLPHALTS
jgi:hypothetical protein